MRKIEPLQIASHCLARGRVICGYLFSGRSIKLQKFMPQSIYICSTATGTYLLHRILQQFEPYNALKVAKSTFAAKGGVQRPYCA